MDEEKTMTQDDDAEDPAAPLDVEDVENDPALAADDDADEDSNEEDS